jgi:hypothetical protein
LLSSGVMVGPVPAQERLRGWLCGDFPFGRCPYADSRVRPTGGHKVHNSGHGGVLSSRVPTAPGMALQCPGWLHSGGDGHTGPEVTGRRAPLVRCHGVVLRGRGVDVRTLFEDSAILFQGCSAPAVREWVVQCHGVDTGLTAQRRKVAEMASRVGLAEQRRDMIPRRCQRAGMVGICL